MTYVQRTTKTLDTRLRLRLYIASVRSMMTYGSEEWYLDDDLWQTLAKGCTTHVCTQERRRPTDGYYKDGKLTKSVVLVSEMEYSHFQSHYDVWVRWEHKECEVEKVSIPWSHEKTITTTTHHDTVLYHRLHTQWTSLTVSIYRYALECCVVLCGRGDCLFVCSRHGDKIMFGQWTIYYKMTSTKTHDWTTVHTTVYRRWVRMYMNLVRFLLFKSKTWYV